ncbi:hypothetical protein VOLCADRAFT_94503 [Volvox carteri f. nagariensis]|uniref:Uncharacterized protein n=1 Tax=Volvox carteri f. nagariensis TaxID=3068 RepID=D8U4Z0_VOLCA|nr:uncharacterized protein VOLCADRAFT_94503 [Volvox carteri f. nagariensis]EFJ45277.1 hypothetical protein VOLCADRAFT_94503 [Volvox carteri f. nagariensis]|eukprot:XP_002953653.1 hypothetical protein VOLCADRAFT_94503 [Volvox carteri f. nagariensis]
MAPPGPGRRLRDTSEKREKNTRFSLLDMSHMSLPTASVPPAVTAAPPPNLVIGIDFGTHASGFAFYKRAHAGAGAGAAASASGSVSAEVFPRVSTHDRWPDQPIVDAKTRTALLYKKDRVDAWGWTAWKRWSEMSSSERSAQSYSYMENFKLLLEDGADADVDTVCPLPAGVTRVQAVADYLGEMRKYIREHLRRSAGVILHSDELVWCLTVPAIWSDAAKARMREAAHRAGLIIAVEAGSLVLTLEPEAAAMTAVNTANETTLKDNDVALVLDCGGGTADATLHCVRGSGSAVRLEEAAVGRGVLAGGAHVDSAAWSYIRDLLGARQWDKWKEAHPDEVAQLKSRRGLSKPSSRQGWVNSDLNLVLPPEVVSKRLMDSTVDKITELMHDVINEGARLGSKCNKSRVRRSLPEGAALVVPSDPGAAVVTGAVLYGAMPMVVSARRSRLGYGVGTTRPWTSHDAIHAASFGAPEKRWHSEKNCYYAFGTYHPFVKHGELISVDKVVRHGFTPLYK